MYLLLFLPALIGMIYFCRIIIAYGQRCQKICLNVAWFRCICIQAGKDILDMSMVQFHKFFFDKCHCFSISEIPQNNSIYFWTIKNFVNNSGLRGFKLQSFSLIHPFVLWNKTRVVYYRTLKFGGKDCSFLLLRHSHEK